MAVNLRPAEVWWEGAALIAGAAALFQISPLYTGFRLHPTGQTLVYLSAITSLIMRRCRLGHHLIKLPKEKKSKKKRSSAGEKPTSEKVWLPAIHRTMWMVFGFMYIEICVIQYAAYIDPETPADWSPWLVSAMTQQIGLAVMFGGYYYLFYAADLLSYVSKEAEPFPQWLQVWTVALVMHAWELGQSLFNYWSPSDNAFTTGMFAHRLTLGIAAIKFSLSALNLIIPLLGLRYHAAGIFTDRTPTKVEKGTQTEDLSNAKEKKDADKAEESTEKEKAALKEEKKSEESEKKAEGGETPGENKAEEKTTVEKEEDKKDEEVKGENNDKEGGAKEKKDKKEGDGEDEDEDEDENDLLQYSLVEIFSRICRIIYDVAFPLDLAMVYRFVTNWVFQFVIEWTSSFEPWFYKNFLDSLTNRDLVFPALAKYGVANMFNQVANSSWIKDSGSENHSLTAYIDAKCEVFVYSVIQAKPMRYHVDKDGSNMSNVFFQSKHALSSFVDLFVMKLGPSLFGVLASVYQYQWVYDSYFIPLALAMAMWSIIQSSILTPAERAIYRYTNYNTNDEMDQCMTALRQSETVKQFSGEEYHSKRYREVLDETERTADHHKWVVEVVKRGSRVIHQLLHVIGTIMCLRLLARGHMKSSDVLFFLGHFQVTYRPLTYLVGLGQDVYNLHSNSLTLLRLIDNDNDMVESEDAPDSWDISEGTIEFKDVHFSYEKKTPVLKGISFTVEAGTTTAIVGATGGGKTTIMDLIARFYDVDQGSVLIDGVDVRHVKQADLRKSISIIPQQNHLLPKSIKFNIQYGTAATNMSATQDEVEGAAQKAQIHEKISSLAKGYETLLYQGGTRFSGGENQRLNIARGLVRPSKILLLDEATSALDMITERNVQNSINDGTKGKTCIVIAHRLPTIIHARQILVIKEGKIAERGTFAELKKIPNGIFKKMWEAQMKVAKERSDFDIHGMT